MEEEEPNQKRVTKRANNKNFREKNASFVLEINFHFHSTPPPSPTLPEIRRGTPLNKIPQLVFFLLYFFPVIRDTRATLFEKFSAKLSSSSSILVRTFHFQKRPRANAIKQFKLIVLLIMGILF